MRRARETKIAETATRRARVFSGLGWRLFWLIAILSLPLFGLLVWQSPDLLRVQALAAFGGPIVLVGVLSLAYLNQTRAQRPDFSERANLAFILLLVWLGQLWLLLLLVFAALYWASGRGLLAGLSS